MKRVVWLSSSLDHAVKAAASAKAPLETGGILIGYWASASEVVITRSIAAGPKARHQFRSFAIASNNSSGGWRYAEIMPIVPKIGIGLVPLIQWIILPLLLVWFVKRQLDGAKLEDD